MVFRIIFLILSLFYINIFNVYAEKINKVEISGNVRISNETIILFSGVDLAKDFNAIESNFILKNLYDTSFFENVSIRFENNILNISVVENPVIQNVNLEGIKSSKFKESILDIIKSRANTSFNNFTIENDKKNILIFLRNEGYLSSDLKIFRENLDDNKVNLTFYFNLNDKAKIKKITFLGNKIFKDKKLKNIIITEEYKFWKFISGKKFLNQNLINLDLRLLKNFYLNNGYYDVSINSSYAKIIDQDNFELIFNIDAKQKFFFNDLSLTLPINFDKSNFNNLNSLLKELKGRPYSINMVQDIISEIDKITLLDEYQSINSKVEETISNNMIDLNFIITEGKKMSIEKINIYGNNITRENVIRNQFEIDEGDPYNEILLNKSLNNLNSLNFFKNVNSEVIDGQIEDSKIINISVTEKPTGEISAGAGFGTSGGTVMFAVKENNYLGAGTAVDANITLSEEFIRGNFTVENPNYKNSDNSILFNLQATETNKLSDYGYKSKKLGFTVGTKFEFYENLYFGANLLNYYEDVETTSIASSYQKKLTGNYYDTTSRLVFDYDKRNQKFRTSDGFRSIYSVDIPLISKTNTLVNSYEFRYFAELYENNLSQFSFSVQTANSISDEIKLSERLYIPSNKLRGFERGKVGPKDGDDFIGGNYFSSINFSSTVPKLLENNQNIDLLFFIDAANLWGVDYNSSINDSNKIRSSFGLGIDWLTQIGPINFSLAQPITKTDTDKTETFRFNIGTTF